MASPFPCCPVNRECYVKENPDRKKKKSTKLSIPLKHIQFKVTSYIESNKRHPIDFVVLRLVKGIKSWSNF